MKKTVLLCLLLSLVLSCSKNTPKPKLDRNKLQEKTKEALFFCERKGLNTEYCILVDMGRHSGLYRLFVWDFKHQKSVKQGLVSHGCGNQPWGMTLSKDEVKFSNTPDSHCSSKGKYKIGARAYSQWGIHIKYWLHGLEQTNSNAVKRVIVLHSWDKVQEEERFPKGTPEGWGCPAVSNEMMRYLDEKLRFAQRPVLFWIYE
ncbi:MAG: murein L,D-transpeptidase catalytic domain family protein [Flavobacteriaceae bacterium]|nr:murein L,D-transpeptidase catalytic domain family protein [Flavobacteriaceae bacterium]